MRSAGLFNKIYDIAKIKRLDLNIHSDIEAEFQGVMFNHIVIIGLIFTVLMVLSKIVFVFEVLIKIYIL